MNVLQHMHDDDTVFALVTKKLTKSKLHELLDKLQEFLSQLQDKDLVEDTFKEITIKKNPHGGGNQVYLNYSFQPPKPLLSDLNPQVLTPKRIHPELSAPKNSELVCDSSIPTKKIKPSRVLRPFSLHAPTVDKNDFLARNNQFDSNISRISGPLYDNDNNDLNNQEGFLTQKNHGNKQAESELTLKPDISMFNPFLNDNLQYINSTQIIHKHNIIEIEDFAINDESNLNSSNSLSLINQQPKYGLCNPQTAPFYKKNYNEDRHLSAQIKHNNPARYRRGYEEDSEIMSTDMVHSYRKHNHHNRRCYRKRSSSGYHKKFLPSSANLKNRRQSSLKETKESNKGTDSCEDVPIHLIDPKENELVYQYLRKPYTYLKPVEEIGEESNSPSYIEID